MLSLSFTLSHLNKPTCTWSSGMLGLLAAAISAGDASSDSWRDRKPPKSSSLSAGGLLLLLISPLLPLLPLPAAAAAADVPAVLLLSLLLLLGGGIGTIANRWKVLVKSAPAQHQQEQCQR